MNKSVLYFDSIVTH